MLPVTTRSFCDCVTGEPARCNSDLSAGYFGVLDVAREMCGETVFVDGKLNKKTLVHRIGTMELVIAVAIGVIVIAAVFSLAPMELV